MGEETLVLFHPQNHTCPHRKYGLLLSNVVIWVGVGLESLAIHPVMFIMGRFVVGLNSGRCGPVECWNGSTWLCYSSFPLPQLSTNFPPPSPCFLTLSPGLVTVLVPLYVSEVSPVKLRGTMGVMHQMAVTSTILLSSVLGLHQVYAAGSLRSRQRGRRIDWSLPPPL